MLNLLPLRPVIGIAALCCCAIRPAAAENLLDIYRLAASADPEFLAAEAQLRAGLQARSSALAESLPQVSLTVGATDTEQETIDTNDFTREVRQIQAKVPLFNVPAWQNAISGGAQARAARARYHEQRQTLILKVVQRYLDVLRAEDGLDASKALQETAETQLENVQQRYSAGLVDRSELENARFERDNSTAIVLGAETELETAQIALTIITGKQRHSLDRLQDDFADRLDERSPDELLRLATRNNYSLQATRAQYAAATSQSKAALAQHLPKLDLNVQVQESETDQFDNLPSAFGSALPSESTDTSVSLNFTVPLYTGGRITSGRKQAFAQKAALEHQLTMQERNLEQQVRSLSARLVSSAATVQARSQALKSATSAEEAMQIRYDAGTRDILDLSRTSRSLYDARRQYEGSKYSHLILQLQLEQVLGSLDEEDLRAVNRWLLPAR